MADGPISAPPLSPDEAKQPRQKKAKRSRFVAPEDNSTVESGNSTAESDKPPTLEDVVGLLVTTSVFLSVTIDENFTPFILEFDKDGVPSVKGLKPQYEEGAKQMMPFMEKYGASLGKLMMYVGLVAGLGMSLQDGLKQVPAYVSGKKKPIFMRDEEPATQEPPAQKNPPEGNQPPMRVVNN